MTSAGGPSPYGEPVGHERWPAEEVHQRPQQYQRSYSSVSSRISSIGLEWGTPSPIDPIGHVNGSVPPEYFTAAPPRSRSVRFTKDPMELENRAESIDLGQSDGVRMSAHGQSPEIYEEQHPGTRYDPLRRHESQKGLLNDPAAPHLSSKFSWSPPAQRTAFRRPRRSGTTSGQSTTSSISKWRERCCGWPTKWDSSWNMYLLFTFGVACAIGHHVFYNALDGQLADNQLQMLRYGTVLAYVSKAGLSAAVVIAFRQRIWTTVRKRLMTVRGVDSLFAATEDLPAVFNWELFREAKTAVAIALFVWLAPLVVILTSNTLLVSISTTQTNSTCPGVRTLNFTFEETYEWREPIKIDNLFEIPVSLWNTTRPEDNSNPPGWFDYYTAPAPNFVQTATIGAFMEMVVERKNASINTCGTGWNCSFSINFVAPGYKCTELASGVGSKAGNLTQQSGTIAPPFNMDFMLPTGPYAYYAFTSGSEYSTMQLKDLGIGGRPQPNTTLPKNFGTFRTEPVVWIGYVVIANESNPLPVNRSDPTWNTSFIPKMFACEHYETAYQATFNYSDGSQTTSITNRTFLAPVINTTYVPGVDAVDGTSDNITATPEANYIYPTDVARYRRTAAFHSMGLTLRNFVNGTVEIDSSLINPIANTEAIQTKLLDPKNNYFPYPTLPDLVQDLYQDIILSMFSNPQFAAVAWAAKPGEQSGDLVAGGANGTENEYMYPCVKSRTANVYSYHARDLWIAYSIAITLALAAIVAGTYALWENEGALRDTRFSSVVAATRGPGLDGLGWEGSRVPRAVRGMKVGYGLVQTGRPASAAPSVDYGNLAPGSELGMRDMGGSVTPDGESLSAYKMDGGQMRYGFGLEGEVRQVRNGGGFLRR